MYCLQKCFVWYTKVLVLLFNFCISLLLLQIILTQKLRFVNISPAHVFIPRFTKTPMRNIVNFVCHCHCYKPSLNALWHNLLVTLTLLKLAVKLFLSFASQYLLANQVSGTLIKLLLREFFCITTQLPSLILAILTFSKISTGNFLS